MIRIYLGKLGSAKTLSAVREIALDRSGRMNYSNIKTDLPNCTLIKGENIINKIPTGIKKGGQEIFKYEFNIEFWNKQKKPLNIIWDEIHFVANSRTSQTGLNRCMSRFLSMGRRITGSDNAGYGHFIFIAQTPRTIDINIKELCNEIRHHILFWILQCLKCHKQVWINSEMKEIETCMFCGSWKLNRHNFKAQVFKFKDFWYYQGWLDQRLKTYSEKYWIFDVEDYFKHFNTHQIENIFDQFM